MTAFSSARFAQRAIGLSKAMATSVCLIAGLALLGWVMNIGALKTVLPGLAEMKANTALGLLLAGLALIAALPTANATAQTAARRRRITQGCAAIAALIGALTLGEHLTGGNLGIDQLLFLDDARIAAPYFPGRPAPLSAVNFVLVGAALFLLDHGRAARAWFTVSDFASAAVAATSALVMFGYLFGVESLVTVQDYTSMAIHTAVAFLLLSIATLCARPAGTVMARLSSDGAGGVLARRLLPAVIVVPLLLAGLDLVSARWGLYSPKYALAVQTAASMLIFCVLILIAAGTLGRTDAARRRSEDGLRLAEQRFRGIFEHASEGIYQTTHDGTFIAANPAMARILGFASPAELMAELSASRFYAAADGRAEFLRLLDRDGHIESLELEVVCKDGSRRWVSENARAVHGDDGAILYYEGMVRDITERKRAREALQDSERLLKESQKIAGLGSYVLDIPAGRWQSSAVLDDIFGIDAHYDRSVAGWAALVHPEWRAAADRHFAEDVLAKRGRFDLEYRIVRMADGEARWVHGLGEVECDAERNPLRLIGTISDITDRKRDEEQLREQADLLDHAQDAIVVWDLEHRITYWNKSAERLYGWTAADAVGRSVPDVFYKDPARFYTSHDAVFRTGEWTGELQQVSASGGEVWVESRWTLIRDRSGAPKSVLVINTDITERKQLEQQFLRAQRLESIGTLAGGIAHDLNNVLAPIMLSIELLKLKAADANSRSLVETIAASAQRGADMVGQVLSFARGMEGRRVDVQVRHLIREMEKIAKETFPKNIRVRTSSSHDLWTVAADPTQLHQVLLNLCINARDAMPAGGLIVISAGNVMLDATEAARNVDATAGPYIVIEVKDTGTGMPQSIIDKIFDPFFTTKGVGKGTGLGLSTSLTIVKKHGGFVRVLSELGVGTRFQIGLPAQVDRREPVPDAVDADLPRGDGETVLVVDDEAAIREITRQTLESFGYRVLLAHDGSEAVSLYAQHADDIGVVVIDLMMPGMDGAATIQLLAKMNPAIRVIAVSGRAASGQPMPKVWATLVHFLPKPFSADALLHALRVALPKAGD